MASVATSSSSGVFQELPRPILTPAKGLVRGRLINFQGQPLVGKLITATAKVGLVSKQISCTTDSTGCFEHSITKLKPWSGNSIKIIYRVYEKNVYCRPNSYDDQYNLVSNPIPRKFTVRSKGNVLEDDLIINLFQYKPDIPDLERPKDENLRPQKWPFTLSLIAGNWSEFLTVLFSKIDDFDDVEEVQKAFQTEYSHLKVSPENTIEMLLNSIPLQFKKGPDEDTLVVDIDWSDYERKAKPQLPSVVLTLSHENKNLDVLSVEVEMVDGTRRLFKKNDADFLQGLYLFNCAAIVRSQVVSHLAIGHFWTGQFAMAVFSSLSDTNPVKTLLLPHLAGILEIDRLGGPAIFEEGGVLSHSGLSVSGIMKLVIDSLGSVCYTTFKPRSKINNDHKFARLGKLWWKILDKVVHQFCEENGDEILKHWGEIYQMSQNHTKNSPPYKPLDGQSRSVWFDPSEIDDPSIPGRVEIDGVVKSMRPITLNPIQPDEGDTERLIQFMIVALYISIFWHGKVHAEQEKTSTSLALGSIAPNSNAEEHFGGIEVPDAVSQLFTVNLLIHTITTILLEDTYGNIYPGLIKEIINHKEKFLELNEDVQKVRSGTDI